MDFEELLFEKLGMMSNSIDEKLVSMTNSQDEFKKQLKILKEDVKNLKDNHLDHINKDLNYIKGALAVLIVLVVATFLKVYFS
jgi:hypothetical protein